MAWPFKMGDSVQKVQKGFLLLNVLNAFTPKMEKQLSEEHKKKSNIRQQWTLFSIYRNMFYFDLKKNNKGSIPSDSII
ncbi:hypothetical protein BpHYR1_031749 [Brachionus plicatilis]|uniref:Uncharacterized protein n=1 Tax=Brachionus plicatilis TaxID=10195 RepID=A0A3M7RB02_BRAPC|nr:hypothetical protein BpHYR1_031749 [Brachionus plicatilis]